MLAFTMILKLQRHSDMSEASAVLILRERVVLKGKLHAMVSKPFTIVHVHAYQICFVCYNNNNYYY